MAKSSIYRFAEDATASSVLSDADYKTDDDRTIGHQPGVARAALANKAMRSASAVCAAFAQYVAKRQTKDISDGETTDALESYMRDAIDAAIKSKFNGLFPTAFDDRFPDSFDDRFPDSFDGRFDDQFSAAFKSEFDKAIIARDKRIWRVGSLYINATDSTNPASFMGFGTWSLHARGEVLVGVDSSDPDFNWPNKRGGEKEHRLTEAELARHTHTYHRYGSGHGAAGAYNEDSGAFVESRPAGGDQPHNNLQPYVTVYIWRRTA